MGSQTHKILITPGSSDVEVKKSHFLCALKNVRSEEEARGFLDSIRRQHYDARHHCFAMRIGTPGSVFERSGDDGEPQGTAGRPMLEILKGAELHDVCAVVTRYFGGTLLGTGGLVRAYSDSLKAALEQSETAEVLPGVRYQIRCGYGQAEKLRRAAVSFGARSIGEEFGEDCVLRYLIRSDREEAFLRLVTETGNGRLSPERTGTVLFADGTVPLVYGEGNDD